MVFNLICMKKILIYLFLLFMLNNVIGQTDTEFWYAFTEFDETYGGGPGTPNIYALRISSGAQDADVTVTYPADGGTRDKTFHVPANSTYTFPILTSNAGNWPANKTDLNFFNPKPGETYPQPNGMHITSTAKISCYVDFPHAGDGNYFVLKGKNALGKHFYLPFQNAFNPGGMLSNPGAYASFSIVATEDNTRVKIVPTKDLMGYTAGTPIFIDLMKGQTYTFFAKNGGAGSYQLPGVQPTGTTVDVVQGGNIAITIATDLAISPTASPDGEGDQIVPVEKLGNDFIIFNANVGPEDKCDDHFMFVATANNTKITLSSGETKTLNAGEFWDYTWATNGIIPLSFKSVTSTQPVYLYHTTVINKEIASALVPSTTVGGSKFISFNLSNVAGNTGKLPIYRFYFTCSNAAATSGFTFSLTSLDGTKTKTFGSNITFQNIAGKPGYKGGFLQIDMNTLTSLFPSGQDVTMAVKNNDMFNMGWTAQSDGGNGLYGIFTDFVQQKNIEFYVLDSIVCDPVHKLTGSTNINWYLPGRIAPSVDAHAATRTITEDKIWVEYNDATGQAVTDTILVHRFPLPILTDKNFCPTKLETVTLNATVDSKVSPAYVWNTGQTTASVTFNSVNDYGTHTVTITTSTCKVSKDAVLGSSCGLSVVVNNQTVCANDTVTLTVNVSGVSGPYDYVWDNGLPTITGSASTKNVVKFKAATAGTFNYNVTVTASTGAPKSATAVVTVNALPTVDAGKNDSVCAGNSITLNVQATGTGLSYKWSDGQLTSSFTLSPTSTKTYTVTVTSSTTCSNKDSIIIKLNPRPIAAITGGGTVCAGDSITLSATGGKTYKWSSGESVQKIRVAPATTANYMVTVTESTGCTDDELTAVTVVPLPLPQITGKNTICAGESTILSGSGGNTYQWNPGGNSQNINISPVTNTTYNLTVTGTGNCTASSSVAVTVIALPVPDFISDKSSGCVPQQITFTDQSVTAAGSVYTWDFGDLSGIMNINPPNPIQNTYKKAGTYSVELKITTPEGCSKTIKKNNMIHIYPRPSALFSYSPLNPTTFSPDVNFTDQTSNVLNRNWNFDDAASTDNTSDMAKPSHRFSGAGYYKVTLIVEDTNHCLDTIINDVHVKADFTFYCPNAFTPNNDGVNDFFSPKGLGISESTYELLIYTRWGEEIFKSKDLNLGWDGTVNAVACPEGVYAWQSRFKDIEGKSYVYKGNVTLLR